jgi:hypothetical protein
MSDADCKKSIFLNEVKSKHSECVAKASFLAKLVDGTELVTFQNIERGRESLLQLNQAQHVLYNMTLKSSEIGVNDSDLTLLDRLSHEATKSAAEAKKNWEKILLWVPMKDAPKDGSKSKHDAE